jgi:hypothetical protein
MKLHAAQLVNPVNRADHRVFMMEYREVTNQIGRAMESLGLGLGDLIYGNGSADDMWMFAWRMSAASADLGL